MNSTFVKSVRHKVSADKNRYQNDLYDLDFTYITDRIVGETFFRSELLTTKQLGKKHWIGSF